MDGTISDDLEDALANLDGQIPATLRAATSASPLTDHEAQAIRCLYALLASRGHRGRGMIIEQVQADRKFIEQDYDRHFPCDNQARREYHLGAVIRQIYEHPENYSTDAETVSRLNVLRQYRDILDDLPQYICVLESKSHDFLTSDAPFTAHDASKLPGQTSVYGINFASPTVELTLALGRRHAALLSNRPMPRRATANNVVVHIMNGRTIFFAKRMFFAHPSDDAVATAMVELKFYEKFYQIPLIQAFDANV